MDAINRQLAADIDAAFPQLVTSMQHGIYSGVRRMVPTAADAEDVAAETFLRAYRALQTMEKEDIRQLRVSGWVWSIAINLCRNAARSRSRKPTVRLADSWSPAEPGPGPEAETLGGESVARLLENLPWAQRTAIVLRHLADLSYPDIAQATGRPEGTVKADVHRGLETLRRSLTPEEVMA